MFFFLLSISLLPIIIYPIYFIAAKQCINVKQLRVMENNIQVMQVGINLRAKLL